MQEVKKRVRSYVSLKKRRSILARVFFLELLKKYGLTAERVRTERNPGRGTDVTEVQKFLIEFSAEVLRCGWTVSECSGLLNVTRRMIYYYGSYEEMKVKNKIHQINFKKRQQPAA